MLAVIVISLLISKSIAQFEGDFWWLNGKLDKYIEEPSEPRYEVLSKFDTDESAKILFRDDDLLHEDKFKEFKIDKEKIKEEKLIEKSDTNKSIQFQDRSEIAWPDDLISSTKLNKTKDELPIQVKEVTEETNNKTAVDKDVFDFKFPDNDNFIWRDTRVNFTKPQKPVDENKNITKPQKPVDEKFQNTGTITLIQSSVPVRVNEHKLSETENICTFKKKNECTRLGGSVYVKYESKTPAYENKLICCILPIPPQFVSSKIFFRDTASPYKRLKRSGDNIGTAQKQRNALLLRKFGSPVRKTTLATPRPTKVVTPSEDYIDPYWNIKNPNKKDNSLQQTNTKYEYDDDEYVEDYVVELPTPGLVGLYSDHGPSKPGWTVPNTGAYGGVDSEESNDEPSFGYSVTIDPRNENRFGNNKPRISDRRPVKLTTTSDERNFNAESQTISYQSNPDFQVLQGFKLLNLVQNRSKISRNGKKTTTESFFENHGSDAVLTASLETDYDSSLHDKNQQVYSECGRVRKTSNRNYEVDKPIGVAEKGSHPSLALVVLTKRRQSILCYATIIHPRAAVTAADCVFGRTAPGEMTLIAGAWRLDEESREDWQKRMASVHIHSEYKPGEWDHDLAILYWSRPLALSSDVQPACLATAHVGSYCKFFGWAGYDQAIRKQSRWQKGLILARSTCLERFNKPLPSNAFCAAVQSRGTVTGIGGPLICGVGGRQSAVGVAVWRETVVVLVPARDWAEEALSDLGLH